MSAPMLLQPSLTADEALLQLGADPERNAIRLTLVNGGAVVLGGDVLLRGLSSRGSLAVVSRRQLVGTPILSGAAQRMVRALHRSAAAERHEAVAPAEGDEAAGGGAPGKHARRNRARKLRRRAKLRQEQAAAAPVDAEAAEAPTPIRAKRAHGRLRRGLQDASNTPRGLRG